MNRMADLKELVHEKLYESLDGREIDTVEGVMPEIPHMLGVTSVDAIHTSHAESGTLLDPSHEFWQQYDANVSTKSSCKQKIETAIRSLRNDGSFEIQYPHGEDAGIIYCEVEPPESIGVSCAKCGEMATVEERVARMGEQYGIVATIDCRSCEFEQSFETVMTRR